MAEVKCRSCGTVKKIGDSKIVVMSNGGCRYADTCSKCKSKLSLLTKCPTRLADQVKKAKASYKKNKTTAKKSSPVVKKKTTTLKKTKSVVKPTKKKVAKK